MPTSLNELIEGAMRDHAAALEVTQKQSQAIYHAGLLLIGRLRRGNKLLLCGNGGSAADAQHLAAELVGRFVRTRRGLPALSLCTDSSALTAIGNDFGFEQLFARQVAALGNTGDVLIAISTSGHSANVVEAVRTAKTLGMNAIGLLGRDGGPLASMVDQAIIIPVNETARIQEMHILIGHIWCAMIDEAFSGKDGNAP